MRSSGRVDSGILDRRPDAVLPWWGRRERRGGLRTLGGLDGELGVGVDKTSIVDIGLWVRDLPRESTQDHAEENHRNAPYIRPAWVIRLRAEHLWGEVWI